MKNKQKYLWRVLVTLDQTFNVIFSPLLGYIFKSDRFGYPDETLSSVFGKEVAEGRCKYCLFICRILHRLDPDHCKDNIEHDEGK